MKSRALTQCRDIQNLAYDELMKFKTLGQEKETIELHARKCQAIAQAAKAWEACVDRGRILRGRPLPGSLRPTSKAREGRRLHPFPIEPRAVRTIP